MFNHNAPKIKTFCKECGNLTNVEIIKIPPSKGLSYPQVVITVSISFLIIGLLELVKLSIK